MYLHPSVRVLYGMERSWSFATSSSWWARFRFLTCVLLKPFVNAWLQSLQSHLISKFGLSFIKITNICRSISAEHGRVAEHQGHLNGSFDLVIRFIILFSLFLSWFSLFFSLLVCWLTISPENADWIYKSVTWTEETLYALMRPHIAYTHNDTCATLLRRFGTIRAQGRQGTTKRRHFATICDVLYHSTILYSAPFHFCDLF